MNMFKIISVVALALGLTGCANAPSTPSEPPAPTETSHNNLHSTLWIQTAAEYKANTIQTYRSATMQLDSALADKTWNGALENAANYQDLPPAIILDVDETIVDNSPYQAQLIKDGTAFKFETWDKWVAMATAPAIPGAVEFINAAAAKGVWVIFLTNRECKARAGNDHPCPQRLDTLANLKSIGIEQATEEQVLLKYAKPEWTSEKRTRREMVAETHRIVMLFGDDFGDFLPDVKKKITHQQRAALVTKHLDRWGTHWYALPNPTYGSWMGVLEEPHTDYLRGYE